MKLIRSGKYLLLLFFLFSLSLIYLSRYSAGLPFEKDEVSWFFHTVFFDLAAQGKLTDPQWYSYEAYDHPPFMKYIFGAWIRSVNPAAPIDRAGSLEQIGRWDYYYDTNFRAEDYPALTRNLRLLRVLEIGIAAASLVLFSLLIGSLTNSILLSFIVPLLLLGNRLFLNTMLRVTPDGALVMFSLAMAAGFCLIRPSVRRTVVTGVLLGLAITTKLTGLFLLVGYILFWFCEWVMHRRMTALKHGGLLLVIVFSLWVMLNPSLYGNGIVNTIEYFRFRMDITYRLQAAYPGLQLITVPDKLRAVACVLLVQCGGNFPDGHFPGPSGLYIGLLVVGVYSVIRFFLRNDLRNERILFVLGLGGEGVVSTVAFLPLLFDRYFLPLLFIMLGIYICGVQQIVGVISGHLSARKVKREA